MNPAASKTLQVSEEPGGVLRLCLNRPKLKNALDRELVLALGSELSALPTRPKIRVVVLHGAGGSFCSGADLSTITGVDTGDLGGRIDEFHRLILGIVQAPQPVIAALDGPAVGFGADLACSCDARIFSRNAFLEEAFIKIGLMPDGGGSYWIEKYLGARAFEVLARGTRLTAAQCAAVGLANQVVDGDEALPQAIEWANEWARAAPLALTSIKHALRARDREVLPATLAREKAGQVRLLGSSDFQEGVSAFLAKRAGRFAGK